MKLKKPRSGLSRVSLWVLGVAALVLLAGVALFYGTVTSRLVEGGELRLEAAKGMEEYQGRVLEYKKQEGILVDPVLDPLGTGLIGDPFSGITTTLGMLEAKRTAAHPMMAALVVELLQEQGIGKGDRVGAVFSGSFPGLNLAVLAACEVLGVDCVYIVSVGSSTYGANQPSMTFPDMVGRLYKEGLIYQQPVAFSIGGSGDVGEGMEPEVLEPIAVRLEKTGMPLLYEPDYQKNLEERKRLLESRGALDGFINVGGHLSGMGRGEDSYDYPAGWVREPLAYNEDSGLMGWYSSGGLPVLHLLNLRQLTADYGLPFDPTTLDLPPSLYTQREYQEWVPLVTLGLLLGLVVWERRRRG